jgi:hypothetical protein
MAVTAELPLRELRGTALSNEARDERLTSLKSFAATVQLFITMPHFALRYGKENGACVVLQFIYQYFSRIGDILFDEATFEALWGDFSSELEDTHWLYRGVANLRHFRGGSPPQPLDLGDGITIRGRIRVELKSLGFDDLIWEQIAEDWNTLGRSSHVLVIEHSIPKEPLNLRAMASGSLVTKALRALQALRLSGPGSISIGPIWSIRASRFNVGISGLNRSGYSIPTMGSEYVWTEDVGLAYAAVYRELVQLEKDGYGRAPGNLGIALLVFLSSYDRWPSRQDSQLLDAITTLEALFGIDTELSFRLAFRVAALLASGDKERGELFNLMKAFYDTRSRIVHGADLKSKHQHHLAKVEVLRSLVRRLLRSFVAFAVSPPNHYSKNFFKERLDVALLDAIEREKLRASLGLT